MKTSRLLAVTALVLGANTAFATAINLSEANGEASLQTIINNITVAPVAGTSSTNVLTDHIADGGDANWAVTGSGGNVSTMIIELAGNASSNTFGIYDSSDPSKFVELFNGAATTGSQTLLSIKTDGSVVISNSVVGFNFDTGIDFAANSFGYYLGTSSGKFYSDSTLNGGNDQMVALQGNGVDTIQIGGLAKGTWSKNEYILAWEDVALSNNSDWDYNDMVLMVESVEPVSEPATLALLGLGLVGLGLARRK